ncbi:PTS galactosamine/N-acetylgalactosamine transporter subunit IIA [Clostridium sp. OS1-26]|uniref:PTS galactosamine/N-acetylgalactosamine transporter subunit IIA n=1 Tax=Clostridium sp. OS1-26 TaxID=3070681 RepID=UPI0027E0A0A6|nr:PTS galactosamine/N-acetylgalactosamine transporter subunit IIA [Clostridium sp. OS1-26]WML33840.1 PTS galactosamine/N-acetylgalactosamine transporter subunit IIA [Clostridium sp. OS1-26]
MIGIVVSGHGNFASGIMSSLELIAGKQENVIGVDFTIKDNIESLQSKLENAAKELSGCEGILFLTDIAGGSPFRTCALLCQELKNSRVVAGTNVGMILEISLSREGISIEELKNMALQSGISAVKAFEPREKKQVNNNGI